MQVLIKRKLSIIILISKKSLKQRALLSKLESKRLHFIKRIMEKRNSAPFQLYEEDTQSYSYASINIGLNYIKLRVTELQRETDNAL